MNFAQIREYDVANGPGIRVSLFVSGCTHNCYNCFNKEYQNFAYGEKFQQEQVKQILDYLNKPQIKGLSLLGGEPMQNVEGLLPMLQEIRPKLREEQDIWLWSGYTFEEIVADKNKKELLEYIDVLIDGLFVQSKKDLTLKWRGSSNQRIIDAQLSLKTNRAIEIPESSV